MAEILITAGIYANLVLFIISCSMLLGARSREERLRRNIAEIGKAIRYINLINTRRRRRRL